MRWWAAVLLVLCFTPFVTVLADEEAARYFTRRARECLANGDLQGAEKQFRKAMTEQLGFLPAIFGLAETALERKDEKECVGILESLLDEAAKNPPNAEGRAVVTQAEAMLKKLDRPRYDYRRLLSKYVADLLALARRSEKSSPDLAGRCADRVDRLCPGHAGAKEILDRVGRPAYSSAPDRATPAAAANEELLFNGKDLEQWEGITDRWKLEDGILVASIIDAAYFASHSKRLTGDYTLVLEMRVREAGRSPRLGIQFGFAGTNETFEFNIFAKEFGLKREKGADEEVKIAHADPLEVMSGYDQQKWNTFEVKVEGATVTISVNGKKVFTHESEDGAGVYDGYPGIIVQCCVAEIRKVAVRR